MKNYVTFYSPGTLFSEITRKEIAIWDIQDAVEISKTIKERYGASPYAFRFENEEEKSKMYYISGKIKTLREIEEENNKENRILISNMRSNGWGKVVYTFTPYKAVHPFDEENDILLEEIELEQ